MNEFFQIEDEASRILEQRFRLYLDFAISETVRKDALISRKEDSIVPFRFFTQVKGITGYRKNEVYKIDNLLKLVETIPEFYPCEVDQKFDGFRVQIHKKGKDVRIWSEDGGDVSIRFPQIIKEVKSIPVISVVFDAEITGWTGKKFRSGDHIGRSTVSGYAHSKGTPDDAFYFANIFDILYLEMPTYESKIEEDLHKSPLITRRKYLETLFSLLEKRHITVEKIRMIDVKIAEDNKQLADAIKFFSQIPGSEGAMIKTNDSDYPLSGLQRKWIKFKKEVDIDAEVIEVKSVKNTGAYNYLCIIRDENNQPIPVGNTYNVHPRMLKMDRPLKIGEIIRVAFVNLNRYQDPESGDIWFNWWSPRPIEWRNDKERPDLLFTADRINKATHGENKKKDYPSRYKSLLRKELEHDEYEDPFLIYPEQKKRRFVFQAHIRGRSVHWDDRRQVTDDFAVGMTHFAPVGLSRRPKDFEDAKKLYYKEAHPILLEHLKDPSKKLLSGQKALVPLPWLDVEGKIEKKEPGATTYLPGYMIIVDKGEVEWGTMKPHFHEYFYNGKILKGKFIDRLIENKKNWTKVGNELASWMFSSSHGRPYVLTTRAVTKEWVPPYNQSAIPTDMEKHIPSGLQYWKHKETSVRRSIRDNLVKLIGKDKVSIEEFEKERAVKFRLLRQTWKGQTVVRAGPSKERYRLVIDQAGKTGVLDFYSQNNPLGSRVSSLLLKHDDKSILSETGNVKPGTNLNPTKNTPSEIEEIDSGTAIIFSAKPEFFKIKFKGDNLIGLYTMKQEEKGSNLYVVEKSREAPDTYEIELYSMPVDVMFTKMDFDENNPAFLNVSGVLFREGWIKNRNFSNEQLQKARLIPRDGHSLCYANFFHLKNEPYRVGILNKVWWDDNYEWVDKETKTTKSGALMFSATITDKNCINQILNKKLWTVSAELGFWTDFNLKAHDIHVNGMGFTPSPAVPEAMLNTVCPEGDKCFIIPPFSS